MSFLRTKEDIEHDDVMVEKKSNFFYAPQCEVCQLNKLCPGINPNYVKVHGYGEIFPVFENIQEIIERVRGSKQTMVNSFEKKVDKK